MRIKRRGLGGMRRHRHIFKIGRMRGLSSVPVRFRGRRI